MRVVLQIVTGILLLLIGYCLHGMFSNCTIDESSTTIKNYYDSTIYKNYKVTNIYKGAIIRDTIPQYIDTTKVIEDYFFKHPYKREWTDSNIHLFVYDTISRNGFNGSSIDYKWLQPTKVITIAPKRKSFNLGLLMTYGDKYGLSPSFLYQDKKRNSYHFGYDVFNKEVQLGYFYKLNK